MSILWVLSNICRVSTSVGEKRDGACWSTAAYNPPPPPFLPIVVTCMEKCASVWWNSRLLSKMYGQIKGGITCCVILWSNCVALVKWVWCKTLAMTGSVVKMTWWYFMTLEMLLSNPCVLTQLSTVLDNKLQSYTEIGTFPEAEEEPFTELPQKCKNWVTCWNTVLPNGQWSAFTDREAGQEVQA